MDRCSSRLSPAMLALGVGLLMAAATTKYRDLTFTMGFISQAWLYLTPVIYPVSKIPEQWHWLASLNPMTGIVEATREVLLGQSVVSFGMMSVSVGITLAAFLLGVVIFNRIQRTFVDIL